MNHSISTRILSLVLAFVMVAGMVPVNAWATEADLEAVSTEPVLVEETGSEETLAAETTEAPVTEAVEETVTETTEAAVTEAAEETVAEETEETVPETIEEIVVIEEELVASEEAADAINAEPYYNVLSKKVYNLAPGATETEMILNNDDGSRRQIVHVFEVDTKNDNIEVIPGYYQIDKLDPNNLADRTYWKAMPLTQTVAYYENTLGLNVVGAMNTALAYDSDAPYDFMVWNGVVLADPANHTGNAQTYLAIYKDGTCEVRGRTTPLDGNEWNVVAANFNFIVKDGQLIDKNESRAGDVASRSMIGIKADGTLVLCQTDGRMGTGVATGLNNYEMGEMMLSLGCVNAVNCDGGGSSTFVSKREGTNENVMRSIPSDGSERATINSVMIVSTAQATGEFHHAAVAADYDYIAPGATMSFTAEGIDAAGGPAELPENLTWQLNNAAYGTITDGVFTAAAGVADVNVTIQLVHEGNVVGEKTVAIVHPAYFHFAEEATVIPYSKSVELDVQAFYGADNWNVCVDGAYTLSLSDETAATLSGSRLTATADESKTGVEVTAVYTPDTTKVSVLTVTFGKGSEIIAGWNFENGDVSEWMGFDAAKQWSIENGVENTLIGNDPLGGQYNNNLASETFLADATNGQVKNGNYALGLELNYNTADYAGWSYNHLFFVGDKVVFRDVANGLNATKLGMWLYIPEGGTGLAFQSQFWNGTKCVQDHFTFTTVSGAVKNLNSCTEADIPAHRWVYASIDISQYDYLSTLEPFETEANTRSPSFIRMYIKPTAPQNLVFYIDDITLDYSAAVDDREAPVIGEILYASADQALALDNAVINAGSASFYASVADYTKSNATGLNTQTAQIYLDGIAVETIVSGGNMLTKDDLTLDNGPHTITFEIADNLGNYAQKSAAFTVKVNEESGIIYLDGHNDSGNKPEYDSVYYVDIKTTDAAAVQSIETSIQLNTANKWEAENMIVAYGFDVEYEMLDANRSYFASVNTDVHSVENVLNIKLTRNANCDLTGEQTLVSIPVRLWSWEGIDHITGEPIAPETQFATGYCPIVTVDYKVLFGSVETLTGDTTFGGSISVETMLNDNLNPWHYHTAAALADKAPTCTEAGYTGRTYCDGCASVVDWGTIVAAGGHTFELTENVLKCACGKLFNGEWTDGKTYVDGILAEGWLGSSYFVGGVKLTGIQQIDGAYYMFDENGVTEGKYTGLFEMNNYTYYSMNGKLMGGWQLIENEWYHFNVSTYTGYNGTYSQAYFGLTEALQYTFVKGKLTTGVWVQSGDNVRYYYGPSYYRNSWQTIGEDKYYFQEKGYPCTGYCAITANKNDPTAEYRMYRFDETGKLLETMTSTGIVDTGSDSYYLVDGVVTKIGLVKVDGAYYYFSTSSGVMYKNGTRFIAADCISESASSVPAGTYTFGADGKMDYEEAPEVDEPEVVVKNGIYGDYYYENDVMVKVGLVKVDGAYYYFSTTNGVMYRNGTRYVAQDCITHESVQHMVCGTYTFDADGKMDFEDAPDEVLEGIHGDYYYENGAIVKVGLVKVDGAYYYFSTTNGVMYRSGTRYVAQDCITHESVQHMVCGTYTFGADGKMDFEDASDEVLEGIHGDYYYENGVIVKVGLVKVDGDVYYFSTTNGVMNRNKSRFVAQDCITHESVQGMKAGVYNFGADGKMIVEEEEVKNGIYGDYYYENDVMVKVGLVKVDGAYYYFSTTNGVMYRSGTRFVAQDCILHESVQGMKAGVYTFGADGKMEIEEEKNGIVGNYFYVDGVVAKVGLIKIDGAYYYFSTTNGAMYKDGTRHVAQDCITHESVQGMKAGMYTFGADGKMVV